MRTFVPVVFLSLLLFASCSNTAEQPQQDTLNRSELLTPDGHNSRLSLDWAGTYTGTLPCADCEGIATVLYIDTDGNFRLTTNYLGRSDDKQEEQGTFDWTHDGTAVILQFEENATMRPNRYKVGESNLIQLDIEGNKIEGALADSYILKKVEAEIK